MIQFLAIIFRNLIRSLEQSGQRRARHYITSYTDKGLWK